MNEKIELLAGTLYNRYCLMVGGKAFNGDDLPDWETFAADENKKKQADAWRAVAEEALADSMKGQVACASYQASPGELAAAKKDREEWECKDLWARLAVADPTLSFDQLDNNVLEFSKRFHK